jgi:hypothetical protein
MKFGHTWRAACKELPPELANVCINYKSYKKLLKRDGDRDSILAVLQKDACRVNKVFVESYKRLYRQPTFFDRLCGFGTCIECNAEDLIKFAQLNSICMRKVCKRVDKALRLGSEISVAMWFCKEQAKMRWAFINGLELTVLNGRVSTPGNQTENENECPICFEENKKEMVLNCGHRICLDCALTMTGAATLHGTLNNKLRHAQQMWPGRSRCPICRDWHAFDRWIMIVRDLERA